MTVVIDCGRVFGWAMKFWISSKRYVVPNILTAARVGEQELVDQIFGWIDRLRKSYC